mgnify:CR=1 FL=1
MSTPIENKVLPNNKKSSNFYESDIILQNIIKNYFSDEALSFMSEHYQKIGKHAASDLDKHAMLADKNPPQLVKRDFYGEEINKIEFHPAYKSMLRIALDSNMLHVKWDTNLRNKFKEQAHAMGFGSFFLFAMCDIGLHCPLCMTDGLAKVVNDYCSEEDKNRILKAISSKEIETFFSGAMFLTEKSGGSDVGRNLVKATHFKDDLYYLNGEKWFCSNANAEVILALAREEGSQDGIKGLSLFLIEKTLVDGSENYMNKIRLKDKLGVKSMASAEIILTDTIGKRIGKQGEGFKIMAEMVNISRIHNALASTAVARRALIEAYEYAINRTTFNKTLIDHALMKRNFLELGSLNVANMYLLWKAIKEMDKAELGDETSANKLRLLTPMLKKWSAQEGVYITRESMEIMGGIGYIEDGIMPKLMRDIMVLPIWEGAGNIQYLDMLRAASKSSGLQLIFEEIATCLPKAENHKDWIASELKGLQQLISEINELKNPDTIQASAPLFFDRLTNLYQVAILVNEKNDENQKWINPALSFLANRYENKLKITSEISSDTIHELIGWKI